MFVFAGLWAVLVVAISSWNFNRLAESPLPDPVLWHAHEMVFGFAAAGFAGYALTAMTHWSERKRLSRKGVVLLSMLWLLARLSAYGVFGTDLRLVLPTGVGFMVFVAVVLSRAALCARTNRAALPALFALLLAGLQIAVLCGAYLLHPPVLGFAFLLSVVGGRMVEAFTRNQIANSAAQRVRFKIARLLSIPSAGAIIVVVALDIVEAGHARTTVSLLLCAAAAEMLRLSLWQSRQIWRDGLLTMLHMAYVWLPVGLALVAASRLDTALHEGDALHALGAGAVACSIYAVAARAVARRADRLHPLSVDMIGFGLLWGAAAVRVFAPGNTWSIEVAPALWCAAWTLFLLRHTAALLRPAPRPVFSGPKI